MSRPGVHAGAGRERPRLRHCLLSRVVVASVIPGSSLIIAPTFAAPPAAAAAKFCPDGFSFVAGSSSICDRRFTAAGASEWVVPDRVTSVDVVLVGGGGGGGGATAGRTYGGGGGGGGGGGQARAYTNIAVTPGTAYSLVVGAGGSGGLKGGTRDCGLNINSDDCWNYPGGVIYRGTHGGAGGQTSMTLPGVTDAVGGNGGLGGQAHPNALIEVLVNGTAGGGGGGGGSGGAGGTATTSEPRTTAKGDAGGTTGGGGGGGSGALVDVNWNLWQGGVDAGHGGAGAPGTTIDAGLFAVSPVVVGGGGGGGGGGAATSSAYKGGLPSNNGSWFFPGGDGGLSPDAGGGGRGGQFNVISSGANGAAATQPGGGGGGGGGGTGRGFDFGQFNVGRPGGSGAAGAVILRTLALDPLPGLTPVFGAVTASSSGFEVSVSNYDVSYGWSFTASSGSVVAGAAVGWVLPLTVTGLGAGESATVTVTTARAGYADGSASVTGRALTAALVPVFGAVTPASSGFSVGVSNYDPSYSWSVSVSSGSVRAGAAVGSVLPLTVTGLGAGESATVTVATARPGAVDGSGTVTGNASASPGDAGSGGNSGGGAGAGVGLAPGPASSAAGPSSEVPAAVPDLAVSRGGEALVRVVGPDGVPVQSGPPVVVPLAGRDGKVVRAPGWSVELQGVEESGRAAPLNAAGNLEVVRGLGLATSGRGFAPNSPVAVYLFSDPRTLGALTTDAQGAFAGTVPVPADVPVGVHTAQVSGFTPSGDRLIVSLGIEVAAPLADPLVSAVPARVQPLWWLPVTGPEGQVQVLAGSSGCSAMDGDGSSARGRSLVFWGLGTCVFEVRSGGRAWRTYRIPIVPKAEKTDDVRQLPFRRIWFTGDAAPTERSVGVLERAMPRLKNASASYAYWLDSRDRQEAAKVSRQHVVLGRELQAQGPVRGIRTIPIPAPWRPAFGEFADRYILIAWKPRP